MVELNALTAIDPADVSDDDLVLIWDTAAPSANAKKATRGQFLAGVIRTGAAATLGVVTATSAAAPTGAIDTLTVATALVMGGTLSRLLTASGSVAAPTVATLAQGSVTMTVTGAVTGDVAMVFLPDTLPVGLIAKAVVTSPNTVTILFFNASASSITGASYTARVVVMRIA